MLNNQNNQNNQKNHLPDNKDQKNKPNNRFIFLLVFVLTLLTMYVMLSKNTNGKSINFNLFINYLENNRLVYDNDKPIIITDNLKIKGRYRESDETISDFVTMIPPLYDNGFLYNTLKERKIIYRTEADGNTILSMILINGLPILLLIFIVWFMFRQFQGGGGAGQAFSFGKSKARKFESKEKITFNDVAGIDEAKTELSEVVDFLKEPEKYTAIGAKIPKGVLLVGPPGTGKTLLARAVAGEAGVPYFYMSGSDFVEMFVGVGASRVRDLFEQGKKNAPCILFVDELDAVGRTRGAGYGGGHDEREQTLNQLLVEMDGFDAGIGVILIAATNRPDVLDPALLRPGRFDRQVVVDKPDLKGREEIFKIHIKKIQLSKNVDLKMIAKATPGFSGADIANLVNESALLAARANKKKVGMEDFEEARDKVMMGVARKSRIIPEKVKEITAWHEAGHALISLLMNYIDDLHKVSVIPRGLALGVTFLLPSEENSMMNSKDFLLDRICMIMGGRAAEEIVFNRFDTGAANDITTATDIARRMVTQWGMSKDLGPVCWGQKDEPIFIGREIASHKDYSELTAQKIDKEVMDIVSGQYERAKKLLTENRDKLDLLSKELFEKETMGAVEIYKLLGLEDKFSDSRVKFDTNEAVSDDSTVV